MSTATYGLHPGARLLYYVLRDLADDDGRVSVPSAELLRATGWANRASLRKRTHELEDAGVLSIERTTRLGGGQGPNIYRLNGDDHR
ncbi:helix-turn-helix domain-containing protein [Brachybacterium sp. J144]|uniref:helix-turn-helix domain-containing protein n=1 Tax=Brachybacterium sp. J144 TaxID=3116487 RepID=UPI002E79A41C|nr:helix-turn-helix domain-containing protein [Brachybacterium sp. J144]MEE1651828.1 helix-turn-helix domain-containing protein [Brachybacterium sp. J144]